MVCCVLCVYNLPEIPPQDTNDPWAVGRCGAGAASGRSPRPPHRSITGTVPVLIAHSDTDVVPI